MDRRIDAPPCHLFFAFRVPSLVLRNNTRAYDGLSINGPAFLRLYQDSTAFPHLLDPHLFAGGSLKLSSHQNRSLVETEDASAHLLLALLPTTGMAAIALYIAVYMWKYGNDASIVVQSTVCNGWIFLFLGTLALLAGQVPPEVSRASTVPRR